MSGLPSLTTFLISTKNVCILFYTCLEPTRNEHLFKKAIHSQIIGKEDYGCNALVDNAASPCSVLTSSFLLPMGRSSSQSLQTAFSLVLGLLGLLSTTVPKMNLYSASESDVGSITPSQTEMENVPFPRPLIGNSTHTVHPTSTLCH